MKRMSLRRFGQVVRRVIESLPERVRRDLENVVVDVEDEPDEETLRRQGFTDEEIAEGETLYGLFVPMELPGGWSGDAVDIHDLPHRIIIYKRPLEEDFPGRRELMREIRTTVLHELHHHFGYSEEDIERWTDLA
ncbi:MAG TPA: metallopeptidase family protein [Gemmataceae bacterium]|nr:metallopeptidase family protein [Gemmataceae bacterium]